MNSKDLILTVEGLNNLEEELDFLKTKKRHEIAEKIKHARGFGDLSENAEYDEAKNEQGNVEVRISEIENLLKNAIVIDEDDIKTDEAGVGTKVRLYDVEFEEEVEYHIVGSTEADPSKNKVSNLSPLGKATIGRKIGDIIEVEAPDGIIQYKLLGISK